jgi:ADP-ribose pyrophosphatase YjhB (NUDIX family)
MSDRAHFMSYERPSVTADVVLLKIHDNVIDKRQKSTMSLRVLLIRRNEEPCEGQWSLPGGFVGINETIEEVAYRKVFEKTGYRGDYYLEQLYTFDGINRDERWRVISTAYIGIMKPHVFTAQYGSHAGEWFEIREDNTLIGIDSYRTLTLDELAFDHGKIIEKALERIRGKLFYSDIGFEFVEEKFTIGDLQSVFETILRKPIANFKRTMDSRLEETGETVYGKAYRPAQLFKKK